MSTIAELTTMTGVNLVTDYALDFDIPVLSGLQRQGDVIVIPSTRVKASTAVPAAGTPVVRGESGGNTHAIYAEGAVFCDTRDADAGSLQVASLVVGEGATAWLGHPEHGYLGIAPGSYEVRRQREQAEELRMVAD